MSPELLNILLPFITGLVTAILGVYGGKYWERRKTAHEAKHSELTNVEEAIKIWRELATDLKTQIAELETKIDNLEKTIEELKPFKEENKQLQKEINRLHKEMEKK